MQDFFAFYQMGGAFNHVVSLFALAGFAVVVAHVFLPASARAPLRLLRLADRLTGLLCVVAGVPAGLVADVCDPALVGHHGLPAAADGRLRGAPGVKKIVALV